MYPTDYMSESNFFEMSLTKSPGRGYRYYEGTALWPFGWGLTYTQWEIQVGPASTPGSGMQPGLGPAGTNFTAVLKNTGQVDSDEVLFVYFAPQFTRPDCPVPKRQLIDFRRVHVKHGDSAALVFSVAAQQLELVGADGTRSLVKGKYVLEFTNGNTTATVDLQL